MLLTKMTAEHARMYHLALALDRQHSHTLQVCSTKAWLSCCSFILGQLSVTDWIEHKGENTYVAHVQPLSPSGASQPCNEQKMLLSIEDISDLTPPTGCCSAVQYSG